MLQLAVPNSTLYAPLIAGAEQLRDEVQILCGGEQEVAHLLETNRVAAAFLSPLTYGKTVGQVEYLILPAPALALEGYTERVWLYFRPGLRTISRCAVPEPSDFLAQALRLLLMEAYDVEPTYIPARGRSLSELLATADAVLSYAENLPQYQRLDLGEEWYLTFGYALPVGFWVCRLESLPRHLPLLLRRLAHPDLPPTENITESQPAVPPPRHGTIHWQWNATIAEALQQTLELLYYHGLVPHIREVTLWNDESS
jgi:predicted solute-binding protein